jgi:hypothetical protein
MLLVSIQSLEYPFSQLTPHKILLDLYMQQIEYIIDTLPGSVGEMYIIASYPV